MCEMRSCDEQTISILTRVAKATCSPRSTLFEETRASPLYFGMMTIVAAVSMHYCTSFKYRNNCICQPHYRTEIAVGKPSFASSLKGSNPLYIPRAMRCAEDQANHATTSCLCLSIKTTSINQQCRKIWCYAAWKDHHRPLGGIGLEINLTSTNYGTALTRTRRMRLHTWLTSHKSRLERMDMYKLEPLLPSLHSALRCYRSYIITRFFVSKRLLFIQPPPQTMSPLPPSPPSPPKPPPRQRHRPHPLRQHPSPNIREIYTPGILSFPYPTSLVPGGCGGERGGGGGDGAY